MYIGEGNRRGTKPREAAVAVAAAAAAASDGSSLSAVGCLLFASFLSFFLSSLS